MNVVQPTSSQRCSGAFLSHFLCSDSLCYNPVVAQWQTASDATPTDGVLTIVAPALTLQMVASIVTDVQHTLVCHRVSCHTLHQQFGDSVVRVAVTCQENASVSATLSRLADVYQAELAFQKTRPSLAQPGLLVMDMDSTLIDMECIDEIAALGDVGDKVATVTRKAMRGELDFRESLLTRVACLKGIRESELAAIRQSMPLMPGASLLVQVLKQHNWKVAVASGGFTYFADHLATRLDLDHAVSNRLSIQQGILTGEVIGDIVDAQKKADTVRMLADKWQIAESQTVAMGDGANDLVMMDAAALGVACHAKPAVVERADVSIVRSGLQTLLYFLA